MTLWFSNTHLCPSSVVYAIEECHRSVQKLWSFIIVCFIGLKCHNYALNLCFVYVYKQLRLHLLPHGVTLCFTYVVDDDDPQTGAVEH